MWSIQAEWREEVKQHFEKIKSEGTCIHRLDEELVNRRREELRYAFVKSTHSHGNNVWLLQETTPYQIHHIMGLHFIVNVYYCISQC